MYFLNLPCFFLVSTHLLMVWKSFLLNGFQNNCSSIRKKPFLYFSILGIIFPSYRLNWKALLLHCTDKSQNNKRYSFANVKFFWHLMWKMFCHSGGVNSIKTNLQTCNLWTSLYVSYKSVNLFWLNLPHKNGKTFFTSNVKNFSHLQMDIFCYFDFLSLHCRRNTFW